MGKKRVLRVSVEREFELDVDKIWNDFGTEMHEDVLSLMIDRPSYTREQAEDAVLRATFYELCGFDRDQDHIDGSYCASLYHEYVDDEWV